MIEMMVVIAIVAVLTATVVGNYGSFRSATVATNMAYEAASTLRQAQLYGLGVRLADASGAQTDTYGVEFTADSADYSIFRERDEGDSNGRCDNDGDCDRRCEGGGAGCDCRAADNECVEQVRMLQQVKVEALCASFDASDTTQDLLAGAQCSHDWLSVSFTRPNPEASMAASDVPDNNWDRIVLAGLVLRGGGHCRLVRMYSNGQISVEGLAGKVAGTPFAGICDGA